MPKAKPVLCRYFYGDYHRGNQREECRLLAASPSNEIPWRRAHCDSCPVPEIIMVSNSRDLLLEAQVRRRLLRERVEVSFAVCAKHMEQLDDPSFCPKCAAEQAAP